MLLSEAIKLGSLLGPQGFGYVSDRHGDGTLCATQAAAAAVGVLSCYDAFPKARLPFLVPSMAFAPNLGGYIAYLNDVRRLTCNQISDLIVESGLDCESIALPVQTLPSEDPETHCMCAECVSVRAELASQ